LSLYWVQCDLARTLLRCATWTGVERAALDARDLYQDALAASERAHDRHFWYLDPVCRAADRFGWTVDSWSPWSRLSEHLADQHPVQCGLAAAVLHRRGGRQPTALQGFEAVAELAKSDQLGWEWVADALTEAQRTQATPARTRELQRLIDAYGVQAFRPV
jgi:hypothetical protein